MRKNLRSFIIFCLLSLVIITSIVPVSLAKLRRTYLTDYIISTRIEQEGFAVSHESTSFSYEATADALAILGHYDLYEEQLDIWGNTEDNVNITQFTNSLKDKIDTLLTQSGAIIYDLYHLYRSLDFLDYSLSLGNKVRTLLYLELTNQTATNFISTADGKGGATVGVTDITADQTSDAYLRVKIGENYYKLLLWQYTP